MNVLFNSEKLRQLIQSLYTLAGIQTNIFDSDGNDIELFGKHCEFCRLINRSPEGHMRCCSCDFNAVQACRASGKPYHYRCHALLREVTLPIHDSGEIIAFMAFGQLLDEGSRDEQWERTEKTLSWYTGDMEELKSAFYAVQQSTDEKICAYEKIIEAITSYIRLEGMICSTNYSDQQRLEMYIDEHYMEKLSLKRISSELCIGTTKLCALAKRIGGDNSVTRLISQRRVEAAKVLLLKESLSVSDIAEKVGFSDYNYFTKVFKKYTGITPSQYRRAVELKQQNRRSS